MGNKLIEIKCAEFIRLIKLRLISQRAHENGVVKFVCLSMQPFDFDCFNLNLVENK